MNITVANTLPHDLSDDALDFMESSTDNLELISQALRLAGLVQCTDGCFEWYVPHEAEDHTTCTS